MPRAKRLDAPRRTEVLLSAGARDLLDKLAAHLAAGEGRAVQWSEVVEKAVRLLARKHKIE